MDHQLYYKKRLPAAIKYLAVATLLLTLVLPHQANADVMGIGAAIKDAFTSALSTLGDVLLSVIDKILAIGVAFLGSLFLMLTSLILALAGSVFDTALNFSVLKFSELINQVPAINAGWTTTRDLANVVMIFVVLYIAVSLILQLGSSDKKRLLTKVIIIALLINFSGFFTKVVIDVSNVLAYQFYKAATAPGEGGQPALIAETFAGGLGLSFKAVGEAGGELLKNLSLANAINQFYGKAIIMLATSFVLWTGVFLLLIRVVVLSILLVLAPLAFLAYATPGLEGQAKKWWDALLKQCFWLPVYLLFLYITTSIIKGGQIKVALEQSSNDAAAAGFLNTLIIIAFMMASILVAKQLGATGASGAMKLAGLATGGLTAAGGWVGRKGLGNFGKVLEKVPGVNKIYGGLKSGLSYVGRGVDKGLSKAATVPGVGGIIRGAREVVRHPITGAAAGLAAVTTPYGIPNILGKLPKDEEKKAKEEARQLEVKAAEGRLKGLKGLKEEEARKQVAEILGGLKSKEIAGLDESVLTMPAVIYNLAAEDLKQMNREGVKTKTMQTIYDAILADKDKPEAERHPAYNYALNTRLLRRGLQPKPAPAAPTTGGGGGPTAGGGAPPTQPTPPSPPTPPPAPIPGAPSGIAPNMKEQLYKLGYSTSHVNTMAPEEAKRIIDGQIRANY